VNAPSSPRNGTVAKEMSPRKLTPLRLAFRIVRWTTYLGAIITLLMAFHAVPAPIVVTSPQAAAKVEQKFEAVEQAVAAASPRRFASIRPS